MPKKIKNLFIKNIKKKDFYLNYYNYIFTKFLFNGLNQTILKRVPVSKLSLLNKCSLRTVFFRFPLIDYKKVVLRSGKIIILGLSYKLKNPGIRIIKNKIIKWATYKTEEELVLFKNFLYRKNIKFLNSFYFNILGYLTYDNTDLNLNLFLNKLFFFSLLLLRFKKIYFLTKWDNLILLKIIRRWTNTNLDFLLDYKRKLTFTKWR